LNKNVRPTFFVECRAYARVQDKYNKIRTVPQNFAEFFQNHSHTVCLHGGLKRKVLFSCLNVVALLLLLTSVSRHLHIAYK